MVVVVFGFLASSYFFISGLGLVPWSLLVVLNMVMTIVGVKFSHKIITLVSKARKNNGKSSSNHAK